MASATQRALADRAIRAAGLMEFWGGEINQEMKKQNIIPVTGKEITVTLKADMLDAMLSNMLPLAREIRNSQRKLASERRRARKYPSN